MYVRGEGKREREKREGVEIVMKIRERKEEGKL